MIRINRRDFLIATKSVIYSLLYCGINPFSLYGKDAAIASMSYEKREKSILVLYASFHGSTAQIAEFMGEKLNRQGITTSVKSVNDYIDFSSYYGIIMGAPIHRGKWMDEAVDFVNKHRNKFDHLPFACFYTCMAKAKHPPSTESLDDLESYQTALTDLFPTLSSSQIGSFAGMLDYDKCSFFTKLVLWLIMIKNGVEAGDYRDWQAIECWLSEIKKYLKSKNTKKER